MKRADQSRVALVEGSLEGDVGFEADAVFDAQNSRHSGLMFRQGPNGRLRVAL